MGQARVVRRISAPAAAVWDLISWRGMAQLVGDGLFESVEFEDDGAAPGSTKWVRGPWPLPIRERLEWVDEAQTSYGYRIVDNGPLPVTDYAGTVRVVPNGPDACSVLIQCSFVGVDVTDAEWKSSWEQMEGGLLDTIAARFGDAPTAQGEEDIAAIVRARSDVFEADFAAGDAARLVANYYVPDMHHGGPRVVMPDSPMLIGRNAIAEMFTGMIAGFSACALRQVEVRRSGDMAWELSEATVTPRDASAEPLAVRYIIAWAKVAGEWRVAVDFFAWGDLGLASSPA